MEVWAAFLKKNKTDLYFITVLWQKLQIQEKAITEVKAAIKPYYQKKDITKEEYKEIVRKAVEKVSKHVFFFFFNLHTFSDFFFLSKIKNNPTTNKLTSDWLQLFGHHSFQD